MGQGSHQPFFCLAICLVQSPSGWGTIIWAGLLWLASLVAGSALRNAFLCMTTNLSTYLVALQNASAQRIASGAALEFDVVGVCTTQQVRRKGHGKRVVIVHILDTFERKNQL